MSASSFKQVEIPKVERRAFMLSNEAMAIDESKRTVELSFSSEAPVERYWGVEILDHTTQSCDLSRLNAAGPLLTDHDPEDMIGVVERAWIDEANRKGRALVRFSKNPDAQEVFQDVVDGIRKSVSVGYEIRELKLESSVDGLDTYRIASWCPAEISFVSIPADTSVGVGRSKPSNIETRMHKILLNPAAADGGTVVPDPSAATSSQARSSTVTITADHAGEFRAKEKQRTSEIIAIANQHNVPANEFGAFVSEGRSVDEFRKHVMDTRFSNPKPVNFDAGRVGMNEKETKRYSLIKAIREQYHGKLSGLELEVSDEARKKTLRAHGPGFTVPDDVLMAPFGTRALSAGTFSSGGALVADNLLSGSFIELLRNKSVISQLGSTVINGLVGNVKIPKQSSSGSAYWVDEAASITTSDAGFGQLNLVPHGLAAANTFSKELLNQSSVSVEMMVRESMARDLALAKDLACLSGTGNAGQPLGIANTTGIGTVTYGAAATWAKIVESETVVATANGDIGTMAWAISPATRGKWKTIVKTSGQAIFIMADDGTVNGYKAAVSQQVATTSPGLASRSVFGVWSQLIDANWAGIDVTVDPYTAAGTAQIKVTMINWCDIGVRQPAAFCVSTDSAAQ